MSILRSLSAVAFVAGVSGNVLADNAVTVTATPSGPVHVDAKSLITYVPNKPIKILSQSEPSCWEEWRLMTGKNTACLTSRVIEVEEVAYQKPSPETDTKTLPTNHGLKTLMRIYSEALLCVTNSTGVYCQSNRTLILEAKPE